MFKKTENLNNCTEKCVKKLKNPKTVDKRFKNLKFLKTIQKSVLKSQIYKNRIGKQKKACNV